jgi:hypothetical protein
VHTIDPPDITLPTRLDAEVIVLPRETSQGGRGLYHESVLTFVKEFRPTGVTAVLTQPGCVEKGARAELHSQMSLPCLTSDNSLVTRWSRCGADAVVGSALIEDARPEGTVPVLHVRERRRLFTTHHLRAQAGALSSAAPTPVR